MKRSREFSLHRVTIFLGPWCLHWVSVCSPSDIRGAPDWWQKSTIKKKSIVRDYRCSGSIKLVRDDAIHARGRCDEEMIPGIEWIVLAGGSEIVATADDSPWHHVFATSFQDDDGGGRWRQNDLSRWCRDACNNACASCNWQYVLIEC